jgi:hypothetical protein
MLSRDLFGKISEKTELLIGKVRKYVCLFDTSHEYYKNYIFYDIYDIVYMYYIISYILYFMI